MSTQQLRRVKAAQAVVKTALPDVVVQLNSPVNSSEKSAFDNASNRSVTAVACVAVSEFCPVWALDKCVETCTSPNTHDKCAKDVTFCGYPGDVIIPSYKFTATVVKATAQYISGSVTVTNNTNASVTLTAIVLVQGTTNILLTTSPTLPVTIGSNGGSATFNVFQYAKDLCKSGNNWDLLLILSTDDNNNSVTLKDAVTFDCDHPVCPCDDSLLQIVDRPDVGHSVIITDTIPHNGPAAGSPYTSPGESIVVGHVDAQNVGTCNGSPKVVNDTATLSPVTKNNCGPKVCPVTASASVTVDCVVPTVTVEATRASTHTESWCVCKSGKIIEKCTVPHQGSTEICCPDLYAKWTVDLSNSVVVHTNQTLVVNIKLPIDKCHPIYTKLFTIEVKNNTPTVLGTGSVTLSPGNSSSSFTFDQINAPLVFSDPGPVFVTVSYLSSTLDTKDCSVNATVDGTPIIIFQSGEVKFNDSCTATNTSAFSDITQSQGCGSIGALPIALPSCTSTDICDKDIADNTSVTLSSSTMSTSCPPLTFSLCPDIVDGLSLRIILASLSANPHTIDPILFFQLLPNFDPCDPIRCYDNISLTYYTKIDTSACACAIINTAKVVVTPNGSGSVACPAGPSAESESSVTLKIKDCALVSPVVETMQNKPTQFIRRAVAPIIKRKY